MVKNCSDLLYAKVINNDSSLCGGSSEFGFFEKVESMMVFYLGALAYRGTVCVAAVRVEEEAEAREDHDTLEKLGRWLW